ncbi:HIT family protein [Candidatus Bealeia paramacronuclearis]|uniref:HIT family protein n=1 Tax=Candidatus Bealeia paramacronuclearis TaxID=1921001 RepID=A0ABZ2C0S2_9PROT|nr:HIT family protein [Candidatus Bealeia paramacronuclearis]
MFTLDPRLEEDSVYVTDLELSQIRLSLNSTFPWILLIPKRLHVREIIELEEGDQIQLIREIVRASHVTQSIFSPDKLNVGSLGNIVPQLHVHVVARYVGDKAWPSAAWKGDFKAPYTPEHLEETIEKLRAGFEVV